MVTKVCNINPFFFISIIFVNRNCFFRALSLSIQNRDLGGFAYIYYNTYIYLRLKQKMDSLLILIKRKHNYKKR